MFDFWFELPPILRAGMGLLMIIIAGVLWYLTGGRLYAYGLAGVGLVLMLFANAGNSGGYKF